MMCLCTCVTACNRYRATEGRTRMSAEQHRILVVDDEPEVRALLRSGLEGEGFSVIEAADGRQAMELLGSHPVSLVTLDLKLGGEDGLRVARELRAAKN